MKSEAVYRFGKVLQQYNVNYLQDVPLVLERGDFAQSIQSIPGQKSGTTLRYFFMLSGSDNFIKPDRMIKRFISNIINRDITSEDAENCLREVCNILRRDFPNLTPRLLDNVIWNYQTNKK